MDWNSPPTYDTYVGDVIKVEKNFIFKEEEIVDPFWEIYMLHKWEKINEYCVKIEVSQYDMKSFQTTIPSHVVMDCKMFLFRYQVTLMLRSTRWKGLIGHSKDREKDDLNSRANSFQPGETDAGEI